MKKQTSREYVLALILRGIYLKGHQDALSNKSDISWEDKEIKRIKKMFGVV